MSKRRRTFGGRAGASRPIDKSLIFILKTGVNATQQQVDLITATTACTVLGIRWALNIQGDAGSLGTQHPYEWWIVKVNDRDGNANNTTRTDRANYYEPEQNVLAFGLGADNGDTSTSTTSMQANPVVTGNTKTMRKLRVGDRIQFVIRGIATQTVACRGIIQLFCKT